ncbi:MAG: hypothetical protein ACYC0B_06700 [Gemmatimonadaceae bacterium]
MSERATKKNGQRAKPRYRDWIKRAAHDALADRSTASVAMDAILQEEKQAVIDYALAHPKDGYRRLAWQMVDADVAFLSPSSVYRVLNDEDLLYRWKRSTRSGEAPPKPTRSHERWAEGLPLQDSRPGTRT